MEKYKSAEENSAKVVYISILAIYIGVQHAYFCFTMTELIDISDDELRKECIL